MRADVVLAARSWQVPAAAPCAANCEASHISGKRGACYFSRSSLPSPPLPSAPKVSVVMPVYRPQPEHFAAAIASVLAQRFTDWELVIVEDPSDRTGTEVIGRHRDPRIRYFLNPERIGLARQHNRAVAESRGELIARFDADDICETDRLEKQVAYLEEHPDVDVVASQLRIIDSAGRSIGVRHYPLQHDAIIRAMHRFNPISGSNVLFRRKVVLAVGGWREDVDRPGQDYEWYSRIASRGFRFAVHPDYLIRYRRHEEQIKNRKLRGTLVTSLEVKSRYWLRSMGPISLLHFAGEAVLLALPSRFVLWLLSRLRYE
jgi:glycosyltransferase involved in cell wall biosynthesis